MIEVRHLSKRYGGFLALDDVSFTVETGQICGLLGPNGAGKSTTMNIMTGCLAASAGEVFYDGLEIYADKEEAKRSIGYLPEQPPLYTDMTVGEYLLFVGRVKGLRSGEAELEVVRVAESCGLSAVCGRLIRNLSKGYQQRVGIAQALMADPQVVILDEPTVGLDPIQIIEIRDMVKRLAREHTVIVSSHILSEIRALCDHIVIISRGRVVADDTPDNLERLFAGESVTRLLVRAQEAQVRRALEAVDNVAELQTEAADEEGCVRVSLSAAGANDVREAVFRACADANLSVLEMTTSRASLEDIFVELTSGAPSAAGVAGASSAPASSFAPSASSTPASTFAPAATSAPASIYSTYSTTSNTKEVSE